MTKTTLMMIFAICATAVTAEEHGMAVNWLEIYRPISTLHALDWDRLSVDDVQQIMPMNLSRIEADLPVDSQYRLGPCDGSAYMQNKSGSNKISLEFDKVPNKDQPCKTRLRAIRVDVTLESHDAELLRLKLIEGVGAAGSVAPEFSEYQWRSNDSRTKNVLTTSISMDALHTHKKVLFIKLRHMPVDPETVDGLPFHKGYFPPSCEPQKR